MLSIKPLPSHSQATIIFELLSQVHKTESVSSLRALAYIRFGIPASNHHTLFLPPPTHLRPLCRTNYQPVAVSVFATSTMPTASSMVSSSKLSISFLDGLRLKNDGRSTPGACLCGRKGIPQWKPPGYAATLVTLIVSAIDPHISLLGGY